MENFTLRIYKYNINLPFYKYSSDSKPHKVKVGKSTVLPGLKYSLVTILLGFIGHTGMRKSLKALTINFSGGLDYTKEMTELEYDNITVYIYNNLPRETYSKIKIEEVDILVELQMNYLKDINNVEYTTENYEYLAFQLRKIEIKSFRHSDLENFFKAFENFRIREVND